MSGNTHTGGCHCGKVRYRFEGPIERAIACNCSMCKRMGSRLHFVPKASFTLLSGEDALTDYQFNKKVVHHLFCSTCGIRSFARGVGPDGAEMVAVNLRCVDDLDAEEVPATHFDGAST
jgi:hypothetical protein